MLADLLLLSIFQLLPAFQLCEVLNFLCGGPGPLQFLKHAFDVVPLFHVTPRLREGIGHHLADAAHTLHNLLLAFFAASCAALGIVHTEPLLGHLTGPAAEPHMRPWREGKAGGTWSQTAFLKGQNGLSLLEEAVPMKPIGFGPLAEGFGVWPEMFSEQADFFSAEHTEGRWEEDLESPSHAAAQKGGEAEKVRYKRGARLSNSPRPRSYTVYADASDPFQWIKDLMPMRMKSSNTVKFSLQRVFNYLTYTYIISKSPSRESK